MRANKRKAPEMHSDATPTMIRVGANLRRLRTARKLSQAFVGELLGLHQSAVSRVEKAEQELSNQQLVILSDLFGYSVDSLLRSDLFASASSVPIQPEGEITQ
jgi:transcriptional regulator with XRE-family HTH domain